MSTCPLVGIRTPPFLPSFFRAYILPVAVLWHANPSKTPPSSLKLCTLACCIITPKPIHSRLCLQTLLQPPLHIYRYLQTSMPPAPPANRTDLHGLQHTEQHTAHTLQHLRQNRTDPPRPLAYRAAHSTISWVDGGQELDAWQEVAAGQEVDAGQEDFSTTFHHHLQTLLQITCHNQIPFGSRCAGLLSLVPSCLHIYTLAYTR
jgi:hypothetical protein